MRWMGVEIFCVPNPRKGVAQFGKSTGGLHEAQTRSAWELAERQAQEVDARRMRWDEGPLGYPIAAAAEIGVRYGELVGPMTRFFGWTEAGDRKGFFLAGRGCAAA
jgi:hypothetical protein